MNKLKKCIDSRDFEDALYTYYIFMDDSMLQMMYYSPEEAEKRMRRSWEVFWAGMIRGENNE